MSHFQIPAFPEGFAAVDYRLDVTTTVTLSAAEFEAAHAELDFSGSAHHAQIAAPITDAGWPDGRLTGVVGLHRRKGKGKGKRASGGWVHYSLMFDRGAITEVDQDWAQTMEVVGRILPRHPARVIFWAKFPKAAISFAIGTPFQLSATDVPGFSEIRGIRLVKTIPDVRPDEELYSIVLDRHPEHLTYQVQSPIETLFNDQILSVALGRSFEIAALAVNYSRSGVAL